MLTDVTGTHNMQTGGSEYFYEVASLVHLGLNLVQPCPMCGGFCASGVKGGYPCQGRCSTSGDECRFGSDCPPGESCSTTTPDCPSSSCNLSEVCFLGPNHGNACVVEAQNANFGSVSNDCPPDVGLSISGAAGLRISHLPQTSHEQTLTASLPCTSFNEELIDCHCPDGGPTGNFVPTQLNGCNPACTAGVNQNVGCANGTGIGRFSSCVAGVNAGRTCDEDSDCPGSSCGNPSHCEGDPATERLLCGTGTEADNDCGSGTCVDACPSGLCTRLCVPKLVDVWPEDSECPTGPLFYHCSGEDDIFRVCNVASLGAGCNATCVTAGTPCTSQADCPVGDSCSGSCEERRDCEAGVDGFLGNDDDFLDSGECVSQLRECFGPVIHGEGTLTGDADSYVQVSTYCYPITSSSAVNGTSGFGGPGRNHEVGVNISNGVLP